VRHDTDIREARVAALAALDLTSYDAAHVAALEQAAAAIAATVRGVDGDETARLWSAYANTLTALAHLVHWLRATRDAEADADRYLRAAKQRAEEAYEHLDSGDPTHSALIVALQSIQSASDRTTVARALDALRAAALPTPLIEPPQARRRPPSVAVSEEPRPDPVVAAMVFVEENPALDLLLIEPNVAYPIRVRASLTDWPQWAQALEIDFLSALREHASFPRLRLVRPEPDEHGLWTAEATGYFTVTVTQLLGAPPISCVLSTRLVAEDKVAETPVAGVSELRVRTLDPTRDDLGGSQTYGTVERMLAELHDSDIPHTERVAFARFFAGVVRAGAQMFATRAYPHNVAVSEADFQRDLLTRLSMIPDLAGRVTEGGEIAGGETDLAFEGIVCENKVERTTPPTLATANRYLGQATTYASAGGRRLSILCILDLTTKEEPPAVLANYIGWLEPAVHGLDDPTFPSRVAVVIVPGNLPLPSDWQGQRVRPRSEPRRLGAGPLHLPEE
jgi:hypothetical protein